MEIPLGEVVHFDVITSNPTTGAAADADSTPTFAVYEESTDTDIGVGGNLTKRTSLTGNYRGSFTASTGNGFEAGKWYSVIASATVSTVAGKVRALMFRAVAAETSAGTPTADMTHLNGAKTDGTPAANSRPKLWLSGMDISNTNGAGIEITTPNGNAIFASSDTECVWFESSASAALELQGSTYGIFCAANANPNPGGAAFVFSNVDTSRPPIISSLDFPAVFNAVRYNKAQAGGATTITLDSSASATNDLYNGHWISLYYGTGAGQTRRITDYVGSTKVATVDSAWVTNPSSDTIFAVHPNGTVEANADVDESAIANEVAASLASGVNVQVTSTVQGNNISIVRGSSYNSTTGRTIPITISGDNWPTDLSGWTITMDVYQTHKTNGEVETSPDTATGLSGSVTQATGSSRAVKIDLTTTITSGLTPGVYDYYVEATSGSDRTTLRQGKMFVKDDNPNG
jgi:hypothetical protein